MKRNQTICLTAFAVTLFTWWLPQSEPRTAVAQSADRDRTRDSRGAQAEPRIAPPGERPGDRRWTLGATVETLDTGVRVRSVTPRSPAERAGLETGDIIVTVEGYQVGRVGSGEFPIEDELQRRADSGGRVRLLVQDRRNNRLTNMDVRLERGTPSQASVIRGEATLRTAEPPPRDAELRLRLVRRNFIGKETVAEHVVRNARSFPIRFEFRYDTAKVDPQRTYELEADLVAGGRTWASEDGTYQIRPSDPPGDVRLLMKR